MSNYLIRESMSVVVENHLQELQRVNKNMRLTKSEAIELYEYLLETRLYVKPFYEKFSEKVMESYLEIRGKASNNELYIPSYHEIVDYIDGENIDIIREFFKLNNDDIESTDAEYIISLYIDEMHYNMSFWVEGELRDHGLPYVDGHNLLLGSILPMIKSAPPDQLILVKSLYY